MLLDNNKDKCIIYDKYFTDDLFQYKLIEDNFKLAMHFFENGVSSANISMDGIINAIDRLSIKKQEKNIWYPVFINNENSRINSKILFRGAPSISDNLGIEEAISFEPKLQSWNISGNHKMCIDWILTGPLLSFIPKYGLLFWYKESSLPNNYFQASQIPESSIVYPDSSYSYVDNSVVPARRVSIDKSTRLIKKTNDIFYVLDDTDKIIINSSVVFPQPENKIFSISKYVLEKNKTSSFVSRTNTFNVIEPKFRITDANLVPNRPELSIHISDGETYSYWKSDDTMKESYSNGISSQSYLSPSLYHIYREIYHVLTLRYKKEISKEIVDGKVDIKYKSFFTLKENRLFKKIVYAISTFPQIDRVTVSLLDSNKVYNIIKKYLNTNITNIGQEQTILYTTLVEISKEFISLSTDYRNDITSQIISDNVIASQKDLFVKMMSKYGARLRLFSGGESTITYKNGLANGPHVKINQDIVSKCNISLKNDIVFNNVLFKVGQFRAQSSVSRDSSKFLLSNENIPGKNISIPLWDITKKELMLRKIGMTAGPDIEINFPNTNEERDDAIATEIEYTLDGASVDIGDRGDLSVFAGEEPEVEWSRLSGSDCIRFSNSRLSTNQTGSGLRYIISSDYQPKLYIKKPGKYVLQLRVKASFGVIYDTVTIHVTKVNEYVRNEPLKALELKDLSPVNGLTVILPNIRECAFGKQGVFWPTYSDCSIQLPQVRSIPIVQPFGGPLNKISIPMQENNEKKIIQQGPVGLSITYKCNNTTIDLTRIILKNMMDSTESCYQCESFYEGILNDDGFFIDNNDTLILIDPITKETINIEGPKELTTNRSIVKSYGGYPKNIIDDLKINIPGHPIPGVVLDSISTTGSFLNNPQKDGKISYICHDTILPVDNSHIFKKGCFHPQSGWLDTKIHSFFENKSSVVRFVPNYRPTQSFKGVGFDQIRNDFIDGKPVIYKSSVNLSVDQIAHDFVVPRGAKAEEIPGLMKAHDQNESDDHNRNNGYRSIVGTFGKEILYSDEYASSFNSSLEDPVPSTEYCNDNNAQFQYYSSYNMMRPGTFIPYKERDAGIPRYRFRRDGAGSINGIEVKLNFFNYINPKDLVIWLEIEPCGSVSESLNPPKTDSVEIKRAPRDRWYNGFYKSTINFFAKFPENKLLTSGLKSYLYRLLDLNNNIELGRKGSALLPNYSNPFSDPTPDAINPIYRTYLLNQDHIHSYNGNISLLFSDFQDLDHFASNQNLENSTLFTDQPIANNINNKIELSPTISAPGYSDYESMSYKKALIVNKLLNSSHKLNRLNGMPLFAPVGESTNAGNSDSTTFSLCIAVLNETDDGIPLDRTINNEYITESQGLIDRNRSNIPNNSLCSWDLIIHRNSDTLRSVPGDILGDIDYSKQDPYIPGYSFIANLKDKEHLLPASVINAPNEYFINGRLCKYSKEELNIPSYEVRPLNILPIVFLMPTSIIGALVSIGLVGDSLNAQTKELFDWFNDQRRQKQTENFSRQNYVSSYDKFPVGGSSKVLISMSKDKKIWYKTEASIFRYDNSIVMNKKYYDYYLLHIDSPLKALSLFSFSNTKSKNTYLEKFLDSTKIKKIYIDISQNIYNVSDIAKIKTKITRIEGDIKNLTEGSGFGPADKLKELKEELEKLQSTYNSVGLGITDGDFVELINQSKEEQNGIYCITDTLINDFISSPNLVMEKLDGLDQLFTNKKYMSQNNIADLFNYLSDNIISDNKIIEIDGSRAYHFFDINQKVLVCESKEKLTEEEERTIKTIQKEITDLTKKLINSTQKDLAEQISLLENRIWDIRHIKRQNSVGSKAILLKNNIFKTALVMKDNIGERASIISVDKIESKRIVFFNSDYSTITDSDTNIPLDIWSMSSSKNTDIDSGIKDNISSNGEGNYGHGSLITDPPVLYRQEINNTLHSFISTINVNKNSTINKVEAKIIKDSNIEKVFTSSNGFGYKTDDLSDVLSMYENVINIFQSDNKNISDIFSKIIKDNNVYKNKKEQYHCIEISLDDVSRIPQNGKITFNKDLHPTVIYSFSKPLTIVVPSLKNRLLIIELEIKKQEKIKKEYIGIFNVSQNKNYTDFYNNIRKYDNIISNLNYESGQIKFYLEVCSTDKSGTTSIPHITVDYSSGSSRDNSYIFTETNNNSYYWINIDPEQGCSMDEDRNPKILIEVKYVCNKYNDQATSEAKQICVNNEAYGGTDGTTTGKDENIDVLEGAFVRYYLDQNMIDNKKRLYPGIVWSTTEYEVQRTFFLNGHGKERNQLITAYYKYIHAISATDLDREGQEPDGSVRNKVMDIFNLDKTTDLHIDFKKIPRKLRNIDNNFDIYQPNDFGQLTKSIFPSPGGPIDATLKIWRCMDPKTGEYLKDTPLYYQLLNEMIFRCYYGSADRIEFKGRNKTQSKDATAWVPYDYL